MKQTLIHKPLREAWHTKHISEQDTMPWHPKHPLTPKLASCPYCYDGHICWNPDIEKFFCSHCDKIVIIQNWKDKTRTQLKK